MTNRDIAEARARVVEEARSWILTPFIHAQRMKGVGVDCAQLLVAVYAAAGVVTVEPPGYYAPNWFQSEAAGDPLRDILGAHCCQTTTPGPGDIAVFRFGRADAHGAIVTEWPEIIHADRMAGFVARDYCGRGSALAVRHTSSWTFPQWHPRSAIERLFAGEARP